MSKVVKLSSVMEREEKLKEIYEGLEEIKDQLTALIDEVWIAEKFQSNSDIAGSLRNSFRASLVKDYWR